MSVTASCKFPFLEEWKQYCDKNKIFAFIDSVLSGYAQLAFNDNSFAGVLMIIATWLGSPTICVSALWGTIVATLFALLIGIPKGAIRAGIYGANAALAGLAVQPLLFPNQGLSFVLLGVTTIIAIMTVVLSQFLSKPFGKLDLPTLVIPYCITLIIFLAIFTAAGYIETSPTTLKALLFTTPLSSWTFHKCVTTFLNCAAEILWLVNPVSGILYLISLLFASRRDAVNTVFAITVSIVTSIILGLPKEAVLSGLYGYNAILLTQVLTRGFLYTRKSYALTIFAAAFSPVMCCIYQLILPRIGIGSFLALPYLTIVFLIFVNRKHFTGFTYIPAKYWGVPETINHNFKKNSEP